jgi:predicted RNA-binding Zn-ribbon protein involved in translation (DUF1610 family)
MKAPKEILNLITCRRCVTAGRRPRLEVGITKKGFQIWCQQCDHQVAHLEPDFIADLVRRLHDGQCLCEMCRGGPASSIVADIVSRSVPDRKQFRCPGCGLTGIGAGIAHTAEGHRYVCPGCGAQVFAG